MRTTLDRYPQWNAEMEETLHALSAVKLKAGQNTKDARARIAGVGSCPRQKEGTDLGGIASVQKYTELLQNVALIAELTVSAWKLESFRSSSTCGRWILVLKLLGRVDSGEDLKLFGGILSITFASSWLDASARYLQKKGVYTCERRPNSTDYLDSVEAVLFVDGLRFTAAAYCQNF